MSDKVREWLINLDLFGQTTHGDRVEIDREIERRTGVYYCDDAIERQLISEQEFREIVAIILNRKKKKRKEVVPVVI